MKYYYLEITSNRRYDENNKYTFNMCIDQSPESYLEELQKSEENAIEKNRQFHPNWQPLENFKIIAKERITKEEFLEFEEYGEFPVIDKSKDRKICDQCNRLYRNSGRRFCSRKCETLHNLETYQKGLEK